MRVFLSYADSDMEFAKGLASQLSKQGYEVWDPYQNLFPGDNWSLKIGEALKESKAMVVLLSPDSVRSRSVRREIEYALGDPNYSGRLFPVVVRPTKEIPWILKKFQIFHAGKNSAEISRRIISALKKGS